MPFPYLEATDSRVNIKNGVEKLPFSLLNADLSFWQENPGDWRVRLKGPARPNRCQPPVRRYRNLRLEGRLRAAGSCTIPPIHLDLDWRKPNWANSRGWCWETMRAGAATSPARSTWTAQPMRPGDHTAACLRRPPRGIRSRLAHGLRRQLQPHLSLFRRAGWRTCSVIRQWAMAGLASPAIARSDSDPGLRWNWIGSRPWPWTRCARFATASTQPAGRGIHQRQDQLSPTRFRGKVFAAPAFPDGPGRKPQESRAPPGPLSGTINMASLRISGDNLSRPILVQKVRWNRRRVSPRPCWPPSHPAGRRLP